jgi:L-threonylcarbamoyladenylate synthase
VTAPNRPFRTHVVPYGKAAIDQAARLIREGQPVAVPTETVYGLAADATSAEAVARIYEAKGRPGFNPLIVHVAQLEEAEAIGTFSPAARTLARTYWPGALTLVVPLWRDARIADAVTAGLPTVALRCPAHPVMQELLAAARLPLAAPSANASGTISSTTAAHVLASLDGRIPLVIDGGPTSLGLESTIVAVDDEGLRLLRPGPIDFAELAALARLATSGRPRGIEAPGQLASHYAPTKPLRLDAGAAAPDEWLIGFGGVAGDDNLSPSADLGEAAAKLFAALHRADQADRPRIAVAPIPAQGLGAAINDRLRRAAAPRQATA